MRTVIRPREEASSVHAVAFHFDDMAEKAKSYLASVQAEAQKTISAAEQQAETIRKRAEQDGRDAAMAQMRLVAEQKVAMQIKTLMPALQEAVKQIEQSRATCLKHWERQAVHLAAAIAERIIRKELSREPEITLTLVREALELSAGSADIRLYLNPDDHKVLGAQARLLIEELTRMGTVEVINSEVITPGGCRVETKFGAIDQQIETQLAQIEEELT